MITKAVSATKDATPMANQQTVDTTKALIAIYKAAFGSEWAKVYAETVRVSASL